MVWVSFERSLWFDLFVFCLHGFMGLIFLYFFVFVFWVSPFDLSLYFFCLCGFRGLIFVFCLFACVRLCVSCFDFWVIFCETQVSQTNFIEIESVILKLLQ